MLPFAAARSTSRRPRAGFFGPPSPSISSRPYSKRAVGSPLRAAREYTFGLAPNSATFWSRRRRQDWTTTPGFSADMPNVVHAAKRNHHRFWLSLNLRLRRVVLTLAFLCLLLCLLERGLQCDDALSCFPREPASCHRLNQPRQPTWPGAKLVAKRHLC